MIDFRIFSLKQPYPLIFALLCLLILSGCGSSNVIVPVEDISQDKAPDKSLDYDNVDLAVDPKLTTAPPQPGPVLEETGVAEQNSVTTNDSGPDPVVLALLSEAEEYMSTQQMDAAINTLERGVRIKPKDPWLWHSLAVIQQQQNQYLQAIGLAEKSIALAGRQRGLLFANWQIIHDCYAELNDTEGVKKAEQKLRQYAPRA